MYMFILNKELNKHVHIGPNEAAEERVTRSGEKGGNRESQGVGDSEPAGSSPKVRGHTDSVFSTVAAWHRRKAQQPGQARPGGGGWRDRKGAVV